MDLDRLIGQQTLVYQLKTIIEKNIIGHAYAFTGPEGIGKRTFALAFAKGLLCSGNKSESCECLSCRTFKENTNPDFYEVVSEKASIGVDSIREMQNDVANRPSYGNHKVYFIDGAEKMTTQAQNCLLKTLEEPPEYTIILLSVTSFEALLPTIQSRSVNLRMNTYSEDEMKKILCSINHIPINELEFILKFSRGVPGNAVHMIEEGLVRDLRTQIFSLLEKRDNINAVEDLRKSLIDNKQEITTALDIIISVFRDCLMQKQGMEYRLINSDKKDIIKSIAKLNSNSVLLDKIDALEKMRYNFKSNINYQLGIDVLLLEVQEV
mgnify:FL=1